MAYTVKQITVEDLDTKLILFLASSAQEINEMYGNKFNWSTFPIKYAVEKEKFFVCYNNKQEPIGFLLASIRVSMWDLSKKILKQELLFSKTPRATFELIRYFIDFGRIHANHVIMCIGEKTNLKSKSLEQLGFDKIDTLYRLEV